MIDEPRKAVQMECNPRESVYLIRAADCICFLIILYTADREPVLATRRSARVHTGLTEA
jgi:hypothetical protein